MKLLNSDQIKSWDEYTINKLSINSFDLMEKAANACANWISNAFNNKEASFVVFCGPGNNGGDGMAISRLLIKKGYGVRTYYLDSGNYSHDFTKNLTLLKGEAEASIIKIIDLGSVEVKEGEIIIDALFGSGLNRPLQGFIATLITFLNGKKASRIAIDIPSGLTADLTQNTFQGPIFEADYTLTFQLPKISFLFPEAYKYTGEIEVLDIGLDRSFNKSISNSSYWIDRESVKLLVKKRKKFDHKGTFGHGLLVAGSYGKMGAATLAARAALRSGVGLLTVGVPKVEHIILQVSVPEAMCLPIEQHELYLKKYPGIHKYNAIGIGPGIGTEPVVKTAYKKFLQQENLPPLIIDADGINLLAQILEEFPGFKIPEGSILTPHIKEFERLVGSTTCAFERHLKQKEFSQDHKVYIILKGAYSCITTPEGEAYFNSTGNPGMATGGSGDVLTGILTGLRAQQSGPLSCCILGVYIHGLAGDIAKEKTGEISLAAGDIIDNLGEAFMQVSGET